MTPTQRQAMQAALAFIQDIDRDDNDRDILNSSQCEALDASRNALRAALAEDVHKPHACMAHDLENVRHVCWENISSVWAAAWKAAEASRTTQVPEPEPPPPADVPLLTDDEIDVALHVALPSLSYASEAAFVEGVRVGEALARQKAGLV